MGTFSVVFLFPLELFFDLAVVIDFPPNTHSRRAGYSPAGVPPANSELPERKKPGADMEQAPGPG